MIFYDSFYDAIKGLPDKDRLQCYDAIIGFAIEGKEPEKLSEMARMFYVMAKPIIEANKERKKNGSKGGRPRKIKTAGSFLNFEQSDTNWEEAFDKVVDAQNKE